MRKEFLVLLMIVSAQVFAQKNGEILIGKWQTEDKTIIEIFNTGHIIAIKQVSSTKEKDKKYNGKTLGKNIVFVNNTEYDVIMIDPANRKEYKGVLIYTEDGKSLELKVKWGMLSFNETWKKI
jgi:hypothetical protein